VDATQLEIEDRELTLEVSEAQTNKNLDEVKGMNSEADGRHWALQIWADQKRSAIVVAQMEKRRR
jgi:prolyl oligopeptidase PreP (S9A serine peptidase family)